MSSAGPNGLPRSPVSSPSTGPASPSASVSRSSSPAPRAAPVRATLLRVLREGSAGRAAVHADGARRRRRLAGRRRIIDRRHDRPRTSPARPGRHARTAAGPRTPPATTRAWTRRRRSSSISSKTWPRFTRRRIQVRDHNRSPILVSAGCDRSRPYSPSFPKSADRCGETTQPHRFNAM